MKARRRQGPAWVPGRVFVNLGSDDVYPHSLAPWSMGGHAGIYTRHKSTTSDAIQFDHEEVGVFNEYPRADLDTMFVWAIHELTGA